MNKNIIRDLELILEINDLKLLGLIDDEIVGFIELYADSWELLDDQTYEN
jgi:hypothetical protein